MFCIKLLAMTKLIASFANTYFEIEETKYLLIVMIKKWPLLPIFFKIIFINQKPWHLKIKGLNVSFDKKK